MVKNANCIQIHARKLYLSKIVFMQENCIYSPDDFSLTAHISKNKEYIIEKLNIITSTTIFVAHAKKNRRKSEKQHLVCNSKQICTVYENCFHLSRADLHALTVLLLLKEKTILLKELEKKINIGSTSFKVQYKLKGWFGLIGLPFGEEQQSWRV